MRYLDRSLPSLAENLALDEALLLETEAGGPEVLRVWQWERPAVVLGAGGRIADDVDVERCQADGVSIHRRSSGGGTVLLGPGCLLFTLALSYGRDPALGELFPSYRYILGRICAAFAAIAPGLSVQGSSDLVLGERKVSGNSQQRKRNAFLHHGSLLYGFDVGLAMRYLKLPPRQPEYRRQRSHGDFLANLPADGARLKAELRAGWGADEELEQLPMESVQKLVVERYARADWIWRR